MKKITAVLLILFSACLFFVGCTTSGASQDTTYTSVAEYKDELVSIFVVMDEYGQLGTTIVNNTDRFLKLDYNESTLVAGLTSLRICDGETRRIDVAKAQPAIIMAPHSSITRTICNADGNSSAFPLMKDSTLYLAIVDDNNVKYCPLVFETITSYKGKGTRVVLGSVTKNFSKIHFLFLGDTMETAKEKLLEEAKEQYGDDVLIENVIFNGEWSPSSVFLYFSTLGYVEKVEASAEVVVYR